MPPKKKAGRPPLLGLEKQLVFTLQFWREYRTRYHLAAEWGVQESTVRRTIERVENTLIKSGAFALPTRPRTGGADQPWEVVIVDVTERPVERPKKAAQMLLRQEEAPHAEKSGRRGQEDGYDLGRRLRQGLRTRLPALQA